ncbi:hypothetical protein [Polyangium spumosum]|uniref:Uncharacterized protein n=1 Tax=Polyangium spumosum TaxID=889282 RepID=A0A6N7PZL5_9BACT|nr:hypothetical protein [Polyangium spumosum]MRG96987.1 hypothetical protein [Polyangium spumosum]
MVLAALGSAGPASAEAPRTSGPATAEPAGGLGRRTPQGDPKPQAVTGRSAVLFPTKITRKPAGVGADGEGAELAPIAGQLDALLADAAQDLGLVLDLDERGQAPEEAELPALAGSLGGTLIVPSVRARDDEIELRIVLVEAASPELRVRIERTSRVDLPVRAVVMLRDLVTALRASPVRKEEPTRAPAGTLTYPAKSAGRTALGVNATLFGGLLGYSIQRASGSEDPRLLYPLLAVGAGGGLVMSILAAEEWDVGVGSAWFLASGAWWPTLAGHLIYAGRFGGSGGEGEQWTAGLVAGTTGLTLSTLGLALRGMSEGGALLAHSGGGLGLVFGGMTEALVRGNVDAFPIAGMGYGAGLGWLGAAALAVHWRPAAHRVVAMDLGALLGGLGGAALGSPLLLDGPTETQQRAWVGLTGGMTLAGAAIGWLMTKPKAEPAKKPRKQAHDLVEGAMPVFGVIGQSIVGERRAPVVGLSWSGALR